MSRDALKDATGQFTARELRSGLFSARGMSIDDMAVRLREAGYLTEADFNPQP